jgi:hypothetical protein
MTPSSLNALGAAELHPTLSESTQQLSGLREDARRSALIARITAAGLQVVYWNRGTDPSKWKDAIVDEWPTKYFEIDKYRPERQQLAVKLGTELEPGKFGVAVDADSLDVIPLIQRFLPDTGLATRRKTKPLSHVFYTVRQAVPTTRYKDIDDGDTTLVELRGTKTNGDVGCLSLVAGLHPNGEEVQLFGDGPIAHCPDLPQRVRNVAIACLLIRHLGPLGFGHDVRLATAGFLLQLGLSEAHVIAIGAAVIENTGNKDLHDIEATVKTTSSKIRAGYGRLAGKAALAKVIGEDGRKVVSRIEAWVRGQRAGDDDIVMAGGHLSAIVDRAEAALLASQTAIYQRGGGLIHPVRVDRAVGTETSIRRDIGTTILAPVVETWLSEQMGLTARWLRPLASGELVPSDPPPIYARTLLGRRQWRFPVLRGVVCAPTLTLDGRIIETPGFDAGSGLLIDFEPNTFPPVPQAPTRDDALGALERLQRPLRGFPFADDAALSVALSAMLTALVRASLRTSPLHAFDAPTAGTGKSMLAESVGLLATGVRPPALSQGKTPEEDEKRFSTVLAAGDLVINLDNCERAVSGDFLCSMLTQEVVQARILGLSERRVLPCAALVLASGNNLTLAGDMSRRAVICRLDAGVERPDTREFNFDCHAEVIDARPELVVAGLTMLRAYRAAGSPSKLPPMGSFQDWDWIRGTLVWLGCADPADTRESVLDADPRRDELSAVMDVWQQTLRDERVEVGAIATSDFDDLKQALIDVACRGGAWSSKSVGWWLRRHKDRVVDGRCFRCESERNHQRWWLSVRDSSPADRPEWLAPYLAEAE